MKKQPIPPHPPEDLLQHPGHLMRRALQVMNLLWDEEVSHTITSPQFAALNALYREPRLDQGTLGQRISLDRSTMAEVVSRLRARGLISTERDSRDGRRKKITLTTKGLHSLQQLIPRTHVMTGRLVGPLDTKERQELLRLLTTVVKANESRRVSVHARIRAASSMNGGMIEAEPISEREAVVRRYFDACQTGDVDELRATLAQDVVHYFLASDRPPIIGDEHLARFWSKLKRVLGAHWSIDHLIAKDQEVVLEWTLYWTHPETKKRHVNRGTDWYTVRDGRIVEVRAYFYFPATPPLIDVDSELTGFPYRERGYLIEDEPAS